ncbi:MAG TPA: putative toxin-antitoxin system toxin component, PIN family [Candidatus Dormibacteraeota bacterium]|nr:putative toxin-antitoxin system toxin component, PIN family [Candidatus Dormibacteraeota bacterium]
MRFVLDVNVLVSALLSKHGAPARLITHWLEGGFELVVSEQLLAELTRTHGYPRLMERIPEEDAAEFLELLRSTTSIVADRSNPPSVSADPGDDYLIALATTSASILVSGDRHLLTLASGLPIHSPAGALTLMEP